MTDTRSTDDFSLPDVPAVGRIGAATPNTPNARNNDRALIRHSQEVGYRVLADAVSRDKAFVSRWMSDEYRVTKGELLCLLDAMGLQLVPVGEEKQSDETLMLALLKTTESAVRRGLEAGPHDGIVEVCAEEYRALLVLAQRQLSAMAAAMEKTAA